MQRGKNLWLDLKGHFAAGKRGEMGRKGGKIKRKERGGRDWRKHPKINIWLRSCS